MRSNQFIFIFMFTIFIASSSCDQAPPISDKKFIKVYSEMVLMQDTSSLSQILIKDTVLNKFKISKNDYDRTIEFYNNNPEKWQTFFDSVIVYMEKVKPKSKQKDVKSLPERSVSLDRKNPLVVNP